MLDTVEINHVQHISFAQSRLTDAVSVILSELLSYEHPSNPEGLFIMTESLFSKESIQLFLSLIDNSLQTSCIQFINDCRNSCLRINRTC